MSTLLSLFIGFVLGFFLTGYMWTRYINALEDELEIRENGDFYKDR
jgi:uncharacterized protein YneF (UPF0154 family)